MSASNRGYSDRPGKPGTRAGRQKSPAGPSPEPHPSERPGSSFAARFGRAILQDGIAAIPSCLYHFQGRLDLSSQQVWFISYILSHKWDTALPYPSLHKMARSVGMSYVNLLRIRKSLVERGLLQVFERYTDQGAPAPSAYDFGELFRALEELIVEHEGPQNPIASDSHRGEDLARLDPSFAARYGRVIMRQGVAAVPRAVFTHQSELGLTPQQVWFITYIFSFRWTTALPYPSLVKMAEHTGYSRSQIHVIKAELESRGYLRTINRSGPEGGQDTNAYDFTGLLEAIRSILAPGGADGAPNNQEASEEDPGGTIEQSAESVPSRARRRGRRAPVDQQGESQPLATTEREYTRGKSSVAGSNAERTGDSHTESTGGSNRYRTGGGDSLIDGVVTQSGQGMVPAGGHESESFNKEQFKRNDSSRLSPVKQKKSTDSHERGASSSYPLARSSSQDYSPYVASVISDFSAEFGDEAHVVSNVTQALRIWSGSGLADMEFVERLYECRRGTRRTQTRNKMAFFFAALREMCSGTR